MPGPPASSGRSVMGHRPGPKGFKTVIVDAGHGGQDPGAVSAHTGQKEKDLTLDMARRIQASLGGGFRTVLMEVRPDNDENAAYLTQEQISRTGVLLGSSFVLSEPVIEKLRFIDETIAASGHS